MSEMEIQRLLDLELKRLAMKARRREPLPARKAVEIAACTRRRLSKRHHQTEKVLTNS